MHRLQKSFAPLPDRQAPEFRDVERSNVPHFRHGAPHHFSPEVQTGRQQGVTTSEVRNLLQRDDALQSEAKE